VTAPQKTTPLSRWHALHGAQVEDGLVRGTPSTPTLGLTDLTALARLGFKGADTPTWLQAAGWQLPEMPNQACWNDDVLTLRLSQTEFLLVASNESAAHQLVRLRQAWSQDLAERVYLLERGHSHACFAVTGDYASDCFAKLCAVDLRDKHFDYLALAQTSVARSNGIIVRVHEDSSPHFLFLADLTASEYLWTSLMNAALEYDGGNLAYPEYLLKIQ